MTKEKIVCHDPSSLVSPAARSLFDNSARDAVPDFTKMIKTSMDFTNLRIG